VFKTSEENFLTTLFVFEGFRENFKILKS